MPPSAPTVISSETSPKASYHSIIEELLRPEVQRIDHQGYYPDPFMRAYGAAGAFEPTSQTGYLYDAIENCTLVGRTCGSTAFSIWCHNTCVWYLKNTENQSLQNRYLSSVASAKTLGATGLSNPVKSFFGIEKMKLQGEKTATGYRVKGTLPWVSNLLKGHIFGGIFDTVDGPVMAIFDCSRDDIRLKPSGPFIALEGTATQAVTCMDAEISDDMILAVDAKAFVNRVKGGFILLQLGIGLGLMEGSIADMHRANRTLGHTNCYLPDSPEYFLEELEALKERTRTLAANPVDNATKPKEFRKILQLRLDAAETTRQTTYAGFLHQGSRGYLERGSGQRRVREGMFFDILSPSTKHLRQWLKMLDDAA
ncbi:MAG: acyl-CoA dehydrogenase family protein [Akkermansiaceae bacterium]